MQFYRLRDPLANRPYCLDIRGYSDWLTLEQAWQLFKGDFEPSIPLTLGAYQGGQLADFLWSGLIPVVCISSRVVQSFLSTSITGWRTYPVKVLGRDKEPLGEYYGLSVTGKECKRDYSRGEIITKTPINGSRKSSKVHKGLYFDMKEWDGSDMFSINKHGIVITEKLRNLLVRDKVTNVKLTLLPEVELDVYLDRFEKPAK